MSLVTASAPAAAAIVPDAIRVMVVDDSVVARSLMAQWLDDAPGLSLVASLRNGREAVEYLGRADPDVVVLDIDMPELDGLSALPLLLAQKPDLVVIMASTLTRRNAEISLRALALGAADYVPKPEAGGGGASAAAFRRELVDKVREIGRRRRSPTRSQSSTGISGAASAISSLAPPAARVAAVRVPRAIVIGASTGGPPALTTLLSQLGEATERVPILVVQHMPPTFTAILAEHIARVSGRKAHEGIDGELVVPGTIYVAPGGRHMGVARNKGRPVIRLDDGPPLHFCRPAVDPLFISASEVWGAATLGIVLTGMGVDGTRGARAVAAAGGAVIAQDEATSVVWGMPGSVVNAGACAAVLPLDQMAARIVRVFAGEAP